MQKIRCSTIFEIMTEQGTYLLKKLSWQFKMLHFPLKHHIGNIYYVKLKKANNSKNKGY